MKRAPLALRGAIVSLLIAAALPPAAAGDPRVAAIRSQLSAQPDTRGQTRSVADVPRGNLRGDIVNNVRSHPDAPRGIANPRQRDGTRPDPH